MKRLRTWIVRLLPYGVGVALGWLLFDPPDILAGLGPARHLLAGLLVVLLLVAFTAAQLVANLPESPSLRPAEAGEVPPELRLLAERLRVLGFRTFGPGYEVKLTPPAIMLVLVHEVEPAYATVFRTRTAPPRTAFDFVSILGAEPGGLTSGADPAGAAIPAAPGSLRQVFPGSALEDVWDRHREALQWLRGRGLTPRAISAETFERDFRTSFARQRRAFLGAPLRTAVVTLWRAATRRTPHTGPLAEQRGVEGELQRLLTGYRG